jgi:zinc protease
MTHTRYRFFAAALVAVFFLAAFASAQDKGASLKTIHPLNRAPVNREILQVKLPRPSEVKLPNGLTVLLLERHKIPTVNLSLWINTGSLDDPRETPGLAQFTAEMMREGTTHRTSSQISSEIDALGARVDVESEFGSSHTQVDASGFPDHLDQLLDLFSDIVLNPAFPSEELEKYRKRHLAALEEERSEPSFLSNERFARALYGDSPAAEVSATPAAIQSATVDQLKQFHAQHFVSNRALLGVVGDFDSKQMMALITKYFGAWKGSAAVPFSVKIPERAPFAIHLVDRPDSVQTDILAGQLAVPRNNPDYVALRVMNRVLGEGTSSRLFLNLREDKGYTYGAYSGLNPDIYPRPLVANTEVRNAVTDGSLHELLGEFKRLREEPVPADELDKAMHAIVASFALSLEHQSELLHLWMELKHDGLPDDYWDRYPAEIAKVTPDAIQRVAKRYLDPDHLQIVCVGNGKEIKSTLAKYGPVQVYDVNGKKLTE